MSLSQDFIIALSDFGFLPEYQQTSTQSLNNFALYWEKIFGLGALFFKQKDTLKWTKLRKNSFWVFKGRWTIFFKYFFSQKLLKSNKNSIKYHSYDVCWVYVWSKFIFCAKKNQKSEKIVLFTKLFFLFAKWNHKNLTIWSSMKVLFTYKLSIIDIKA